MNRTPEERISAIRSAESETFDLIIIGGGIHGAALARETALRGYSVLLLEASEFGWGTSSRSSKLLHGGVRYLETGNIGLVREALVERAIALSTAPHLTRPLRFSFPIIQGLTRPAWQVALGLKIYDLLAKPWGVSEIRAAQHLFPDSEQLLDSAVEYRELRDLGLKFSSLLRYSDAQMDDRALVIANLRDASVLGAVCLERARVVGLAHNSEQSGSWRISWRDGENGDARESVGKFLVNLAGPWVPAVHQLISAWPVAWPIPVFSSGTHLVFKGEVSSSGIILPGEVKGRVYFVLPYFEPLSEELGTKHTLVGTTDVSVQNNEENPQPTPEEIGLLFSFLKRDLPQAKLDESNLVRAFAGMRVLAGSRDNRPVSNVSRNEVLLERENYLALLGGKYTTSRLTAEKIADRIDQRFGRPKYLPQTPELSTRTRPLPEI